MNQIKSHNHFLGLYSSPSQGLTFLIATNLRNIQRSSLLSVGSHLLFASHEVLDELIDIVLAELSSHLAENGLFGAEGEN